MTYARGQVKFRRIGRRVVPIFQKVEAGKGVAKVALASGIIKKVNPPKTTTPNRFLQAVGFSASVASGALGAATFFSGGKGFAAGLGGGLALDALSTSSNVASFAKSKGRLKSRAKAAARQEAINQIAGYGVFFGGLLLNHNSRQKLIGGAVKTFQKVRTFI